MGKAPMKECPSCKKVQHVRVAKCACGYVFYQPKKRSKNKDTESVEEFKEDASRELTLEEKLGCCDTSDDECCDTVEDDTVIVDGDSEVSIV